MAHAFIIQQTLNAYALILERHGSPESIDRVAQGLRELGDALVEMEQPQPWEQKPKYEHDCDDCVFLGSIQRLGETDDCYVCSDTLLIRHSDEPSDNRARSIALARETGDHGFEEAVGLYARYSKRGWRSAIADL